MRATFLLVVSCFTVYTEALECGIGKVNSENIKQTLSVCVKNNETLEKIWEMAASTATSSSESKESSASSEEDQNSRKSRPGRTARETGRVQGGTIQVNEKKTEDDILIANATESSSERADVTTTSGNMDTPETCVVQCVLQNLGMTDDKGLPDHAKVVEGLLKAATGRELRTFLQESADDCFQQMDQGNNLDSCAYSSKLVTCLANKGRLNCADWPTGNLPF